MLNMVFIQHQEYYKINNFKVIRKRFGTSRLGLQKAALRKLVRLNRANAVRRRNEIAAAKA